MSIPVYETVSALRGALAAARPRSVGFVPTMGALHAGHASLIELARRESETVVVSIFVNPLQFERTDDYQRYAHTPTADVELCESSGADLIFAPSLAEMYPNPPQTFVDVEGLTAHFCGVSRPGHFRGVATVVLKLFHIVEPQLAFFGEKDAQQLAVIRHMVADLNLPIRIVAAPIVREANGLAMSSRNRRLNQEERTVAVCLYRALTEAEREIKAGQKDVKRIQHACLKHLDHPEIQVDYFDLADPATMTPVDVVSGPVLALGAIWVGQTRLIDNLRCEPPNLSR